MVHEASLRRRLLASSLKSATTTAAIVATLGGWLIFGTSDPQNDSALTAQDAPGIVFDQAPLTTNEAPALPAQPLLPRQVPQLPNTNDQQVNPPTDNQQSGSNNQTIRPRSRRPLTSTRSSR